MIKLVLIAIMSLGLIACEGGEGEDSTSKAIYGLDFDYDDSHPVEIGVDDNGLLEPFIIDMNDMVQECGKKYYKSPVTGDVFEAVEINGNWHAKQMGFYAEYDKSIGGFQTVGYLPAQRVSVGKFVVISQHAGLTEYWNWQRVNYQHIPSHDNCMVIIDEANQDIMAVDLTNDTTTSIF